MILGIVTLGTTFVDAHMDQIKAIAGDVLSAYPILLALVLFLTCALLYSQGATTVNYSISHCLRCSDMGNISLFVAVTRVFVLPTYPTLAAIEFDYRVYSGWKIYFKSPLHATRARWNYCRCRLRFYHCTNDCLTLGCEVSLL